MNLLCGSIKITNYLVSHRTTNRGHFSYSSFHNDRLTASYTCGVRQLLIWPAGESNKWPSSNVQTHVKVKLPRGLRGYKGRNRSPATSLSHQITKTEQSESV